MVSGLTECEICSDEWQNNYVCQNNYEWRNNSQGHTYIMNVMTIMNVTNDVDNNNMCR